MSRNAVLLPPFLKEIALTEGETAVGAIRKIFAKRINKKEEENATEELDAEEEIMSGKDNKRSAKKNQQKTQRRATLQT